MYDIIWYIYMYEHDDVMAKEVLRAWVEIQKYGDIVAVRRLRMAI